MPNFGNVIWDILLLIIGAIASPYIKTVFDKYRIGISNRWSSESRKRSIAQMKTDYIIAKAGRADLNLTILETLREIIKIISGGLAFLAMSLIFVTQSPTFNTIYFIGGFALFILWGSNVRTDRLKRVVRFPSYEKTTLEKIATLENKTVEQVKQELAERA